MSQVEDNLKVPDSEDRALKRCCELVESRYGLQFSSERLILLKRHLRSRAAARNVPDLGAYVSLLDNYGNEEEWDALIELLTVHESSFFRHDQSFDLLNGEILPELVKRKNSSGELSLRVWSAGCATGEEVWSLGMTTLNFLDTPHLWNIMVLGTDISQSALTRAREGFYTISEMRNVPPVYRSRFFRPISARNSELSDISRLPLPNPVKQKTLKPQTGEISTTRPPLIVRPSTGELKPGVRPSGLVRYTVGDELRGLARFSLDNIFQADLSRAPYDIIFCQNVLIYFTAKQRAQALYNLRAILRPGGYLVPGPGEVSITEVSTAGLQVDSSSFGQGLYRRSLE